MTFRKRKLAIATGIVWCVTPMIMWLYNIIRLIVVYGDYFKDYLGDTTSGFLYHYGFVGESGPLFYYVTLSMAVIGLSFLMLPYKKKSIVFYLLGVIAYPLALAVDLLTYRFQGYYQWDIKSILIIMAIYGLPILTYVIFGIIFITDFKRKRSNIAKGFVIAASSLFLISIVSISYFAIYQPVIRYDDLSAKTFYYLFSGNIMFIIFRLLQLTGMILYTVWFCSGQRRPYRNIEYTPINRESRIFILPIIIGCYFLYRSGKIDTSDALALAAVNGYMIIALYDIVGLLCICFGIVMMKLKKYQKLDRYHELLNQRKEVFRQMKIYVNSVREMEIAETEVDYLRVADGFRSVLDYRDAAEKCRECENKADEWCKDQIYDQALRYEAEETVSSVTKAIDLYKYIAGWRDSNDRAKECVELLVPLTKKEEEERPERERCEAIRKRRHKIIKYSILAASLLAVLIISFVLYYQYVMKPASMYAKAAEYVVNGKYEEAIELYAELKDRSYKDSNVQYNSTWLKYGDYLTDNKQFEQALTAFDKAKENVSAFIVKERKQKVYYYWGEQLLEEKDYVNSKEKFTLADGYMDAKQKIEDIGIRAVVEGDRIDFGQYEQDNNASNGREDLQWIVLKRDGNKILLMSVYGIECMPYHTIDQDITWENCSLRSWLNNSFYFSAFTDSERDMIIETNVINNPKQESRGGKDTLDRIYILSKDELPDYDLSIARQKCYPTLFAISKGAEINMEGYGSYWLRQTGTAARNTNYYAYVGNGNKSSVVMSRNKVVRPVLWIEIN